MKQLLKRLFTIRKGFEDNSALDNNMRFSSTFFYIYSGLFWIYN